MGTDDGNVWRTDDGGANWNNLSASLPDRWVTKVKADRFDSNKVYVTLSGYRYGEDDGHVYYSEDRGDTWTDITTNLPDIPVNDIEDLNDGSLMLATDIGVLRTDTPGDDWEPFNDNMPSVVVTDLFRDESSAQQVYIYAATYGRSAYRTTTSILNTDEAYSDKFAVYPNPAKDFVNIELAEPFDALQVGLYDTMGRLISEDSYSEEKRIQLDVSNIAAGIYYVKIADGQNSTTRKLIIK